MIKIEVDEGRLPWIVGIGTILFGILLGILLALYSKASTVLMQSAYAVVFLIIGAGVFLCMDGKNRRLTIEDSELCYRNWLGRQITFSLDEIGYCSTALERNGGKDYLKLYDLQGKKLCKLEYHMKDCVLFLQYLLDNQVTLKCSEKSDELLKSMIHTTTVSAEEIPAKVNEVYNKAKKLVLEWEKENQKLDAVWKMGIATYLAERMSEEKQLWEQESYPVISHIGKTGNQPEEKTDALEGLPEGYLIVIEGYLQKDGQFVVDRKDQAVAFYVPVVCVSRSFQIGEQLKIRYFGNALEELSEQLDIWTHILPINRYHMEMLSIKHELKERI